MGEFSIVKYIGYKEWYLTGGTKINQQKCSAPTVYQIMLQIVEIYEQNRFFSCSCVDYFQWNMQRHGSDINSTAWLSLEKSKMKQEPHPTMFERDAIGQ